jgi:hypothetical protein
MSEIVIFRGLSTHTTSLAAISKRNLQYESIHLDSVETEYWSCGVSTKPADPIVVVAAYLRAFLGGANMNGLAVTSAASGGI